VLGLGALDAARCLTALEELARAAFAEGEGIVRLQASRGGDGRVRLVGLARALGPEPPTWRAVTAPFAHDGPSPFAGVKLSGHPRIALAREHARGAGADEALLCDAAQRVVEGARTSLFAVLAGGRLVTPRVESGAVAGVGREILLERVSEATQGDVPRAALVDARELIAVSSARGARAIVALDGAPVGDRRPGPWAARLDAILAAEE
jgi:branched-subunit amino acid aminotransferase/4-amino-4-deoxychorismate lyase